MAPKKREEKFAHTLFSTLHLHITIYIHTFSNNISLLLPVAFASTRRAATHQPFSLLLMGFEFGVFSKCHPAN
jgi:hypothetical protein